MLKMQRLAKNLLLPMCFVLPFWLTVGRGFLGSGGWLTFAYLLYAPILGGALLIVAFMILRREDVRSSKGVSPVEAVLLLILYSALFLHGVFLVDGGDTQESVKSLATMVLGRSFEGASSLASWVMLILALISLAILFIGSLFANRRTGPNTKKTIIVVVVAALAIGGYALIDRGSPTTKDSRVSRDFQLLSQDIENYSYTHNEVPSTLNVVVGNGYLSSEENVESRLSQYSYVVKSNTEFALCGTFLTDTQSNAGASEGPTKAYKHHKGYECFTFEIY